MSRAPVHIMRFAPADYLLDEFVMECYRRREHRTLAFYSAFLFKSHLEGGSLPVDHTRLAATLLMTPRDVAPALERCMKAGKIQEKGGRLYHKRVAEEVAAAQEYIEGQSEHGKRGGRPRKPKAPIDKEKGTLSDPESQPQPQPTPLPEPQPKPEPEPTPLPSGTPPNGDQPAASRVKRTALYLSDDARNDYGRAVWAAFVDRRGPGPHEPSSNEWSQLSRWMDAGIPLRIVLRGIQDTGGKPRTLMACDPAVQEEHRRVARLHGPAP